MDLRSVAMDGCSDELKKEEERRRRRHHAVCLPFPAQGHINPFMILADILYSNGFFITFVLTDFDRARLHSSGCSTAGSPGFRFRSIPDGLPLPPPAVAGSSSSDNRHIPSLCRSMQDNGYAHFRDVLVALAAEDEDDAPPVSVVFWDGIASFGRRAAAELGLRDVMVWTASAAGLLGYLHFPVLCNRGLFPLPDESCVTNGYLDAAVDWIPGMEKLTLRDLPEFMRRTDAGDIMFNFAMKECQSAAKASAVLINTFDDLESVTLAALSHMLPRGATYTVGPLFMMLNDEIIKSRRAVAPELSLWAEDDRCTEWLDGREAGSVIYVNFGSVINLPSEQLSELAWGLAKSGKAVLWVVRSDLVVGAEAGLPAGAVEEMEGRCLISGWCAQRAVLRHPSVGAFLTHCGWNSMMEAIGAGVPMVCLPCFAEQATNCYYACREWGIGVELSADAGRAEVEEVVRRVVDDGKEGEMMREKAARWKAATERAVGAGGSSHSNLKELLDRFLGW